MFPGRKDAARVAAVLLLLIVAYFTTQAAHGATQQLPAPHLPAFWGKVESPANTKLGKDRMVTFVYTVYNDTGETVRNLQVIFEKKDFGSGWVIKRLDPGGRTRLVVKVKYRKMPGTIQFCGKATLGMVGLYWSTLTIEPCYNHLT